MNRRNIILIVAAMLMLPIGLIAGRPTAQRPTSDTSEMVFNKIDSNHNGSISLKEFQKAFPQRTRSFDGKTPSFRPPTSRPPSGFDGRSPSFRPPSYDRPSRSRSSSDSPSRSRSSSDNRSPDRESRYKEMISRFDKNNDGKLDEKERDEAKKYFMSRYRNYKK